MASFGWTFVREWHTKHPGDRRRDAYMTLFLLNTNRIIEMKASSYAFSSDFWYSNNPNDPRDSPDHLTAFWDPAIWEAYHNMEPAHKFGTFPIFPGWDRTETPVDTSIEWANIAYFYGTYQDWANGHSRMVYYTEAWKRVECLVDVAVLDILTLQDAS